jgi:hypothetical protein
MKDGPRAAHEIEVLRTFYFGDCEPLSEVIAVIKSLPAEGAERFLQAILASPAVERMHRGNVLCQDTLPDTWEGLFPTPEQSLKLIADAAGQTSVAERTSVERKLSEDSKEQCGGKGSGVEITGQYLDSLGKPRPGDASEKAARRARAKLGMSKPRGRPRKSDITE